MAYYRLYFFDGSDRIHQFREFELNHDLLAIQQAAEWRSNVAMELWTGTRMVRRWDCLASEGAQGSTVSRLRPEESPDSKLSLI